MTRYEKSDAQLDAEAEARRRGLEPPKHDHGFDDPDAYEVPSFPPSGPPDPAPDPVGLARLIEDHRAAFRADLLIPKLVSRQPPTSLDRNSGVLHQEPAAAIGMTIAGRLLKLFGHPEGYGQDLPWRKALWLLRVECRRKHPQHRSAERPFWRGSLCHQAVRLVVIGGEAKMTGPLSAEQAAGILRLDHIEPLLLNAFRDIDGFMDDFRERAEKRAREEAGLAAPVNAPSRVGERHDQGGMHPQDCAKCRRAMSA